MSLFLSFFLSFFLFLSHVSFFFPSIFLFYLSSNLFLLSISFPLSFLVFSFFSFGLCLFLFSSLLLPKIFPFFSPYLSRFLFFQYGCKRGTEKERERGGYYKFPYENCKFSFLSRFSRFFTNRFLLHFIQAILANEIWAKPPANSQYVSPPVSGVTDTDLSTPCRVTLSIQKQSFMKSTFETTLSCREGPIQLKDATVH